MRKAIVCLLGALGYCFGSLHAGSLDWLPEAFPAENESMLCSRDFLDPEVGAAVLGAALIEFDSQQRWKAYNNLVRSKILEGVGLSPLPMRRSLNPIVHSIREYDGFRVESIALETVSGFWLTGSLYRPSGRSELLPAVLSTHGHSRSIRTFDDWKFHGRFHEQSQMRAIGLAKMGAVVLSIDMFGYGDSIALVGEEAHRTDTAMRIQLWNAIRAVDFLESLPEVDPSRIGVTGASGGGTQAFLLAAVDDRVAASVPVVMVSSYFFGGCPCESGRPIHRSKEHFASNPMIAAMAAPRPQLLISDGADWTVNTPEVEYPFIQKIYELHGAADRVSNVHLADEGHDYGPSKRAAMYSFFGDVFGLDVGAIQSQDGEFDESDFPVELPETMFVFDENHPLPANAVRNAELVSLAIDQAQ